MKFHVLGPLEVWQGDRRLALGGNMQRALLASLLLEANLVVPTDHLIDKLWGEDPPPTARNLLQGYVSKVRRALQQGPGTAQLLRTQPRGYLLRVEEGRLDLHRFQHLLESARRAAAQGADERAASRFDEALALWRGPALADIGCQYLRQIEAPRLEELRLQALEERIEARLRLGHDAQLVGELDALVAVHPVRETFRAQLMLALYRSGRQAEALGIYRDARAVLIEDLGVEPGPELQRLQQAILAGDPSLEAPSAPVRLAKPITPCQLPPDIDDFTGRTDMVAAIRGLLHAERSGDATAVLVTTITGKAGIGKTALALHVAHQLRLQFPDGQLYVNLRGTEEQPLGAAEVLEAFLHALKVDGASIPLGFDERVGLYRARLADRRVLVMLDNAASEAQVRPLLPGSATCAVIVTSRSRLAGLEGARAFELEVLPPGQAEALLGKIAGPDRLAAEPEAASRIAMLCGYLPLAVRVAGARLAAKPHWALVTMVERLSDEHRRLDELAIGDLEVRASVTLSYRALAAEERRAFRLLGLVIAPSFATWTAAAMLDVPMPTADHLLERLFDAQLLESVGRDVADQMRYRFHDLLRVFARERLRAEEPEEARRAALRRHHETSLLLAEEADARLRLGEPRPPAQHGSGAELIRKTGVVQEVRHRPQRWLEAERTGLVGVVEQAHGEGLWAIATRLACALAGFFEIRSHWDDWWHSHRLASHAGQLAGDPYDQAMIQHNLGHLHRQQGRFHAAAACFQQALDQFHALGQRKGVATTLHGLAQVHLDQGNLHEASADFERCLEVFRELGDRLGEGVALRRLGFVRREQGDFDDAGACFAQALAIFRRLGDRRGEAYTLHSIGVLYREQGRFDEAIACFNRLLPTFHKLGDRRGEATVLHALGDAYRDGGRDEASMASFERCLAIFGELGDPLWEAAVLHSLGDLHREQGRFDEAAACFDRALPVVRSHGDRRGEAAILHSLGSVHHYRGHVEQAIVLFRQSLKLFRELGFSFWAARSLESLHELGVADGSDPSLPEHSG